MAIGGPSEPAPDQVVVEGDNLEVQVHTSETPSPPPEPLGPEPAAPPEHPEQQQEPQPPDTEPEAQPEFVGSTAPEPPPATVAVANRYGASTSDKHGNALVFEADAPQEVPHALAVELLSMKDGGYYIAGDEDNVSMVVDPGAVMAARIGKTMRSPFTDTAEVQAALAAEREAATVNIGGSLYNVSELDIPPKHGRGSSAAAWQDYAEGLGITIPDGVTNRDQLVAYLDATGVPTQQDFGHSQVGPDPSDGDVEEGGGALTTATS